MFVPFQDAMSLPAQVDTPEYRHAEWALPATAATAARDAEGRLHLALVNADPHRRSTIAVSFVGTGARSASGRILTAATMDAHNTFERPTAVQPTAFKATRKGDALLFELPPMSVVVATVDR
jgi:alpha-N-arabinofuranosidase